MMARTAVNCRITRHRIRFWERPAGAQGGGRCRRYPPSVVVDGKAVQPQTAPADACGEFMPAAEIPAAGTASGLDERPLRDRVTQRALWRCAECDKATHEPFCPSCGKPAPSGPAADE